MISNGQCVKLVLGTVCNKFLTMFYFTESSRQFYEVGILFPFHRGGNEMQKDNLLKEIHSW